MDDETKKEQYMMVVVIREGINVNGSEYWVGKGAWKHECEREKAMIDEWIFQ